MNARSEREALFDRLRAWVNAARERDGGRDAQRDAQRDAGLVGGRDVARDVERDAQRDVEGDVDADIELQDELSKASAAQISLGDFRAVWNATDVELEPRRTSPLTCDKVLGLMFEEARERELALGRAGELALGRAGELALGETDERAFDRIGERARARSAPWKRVAAGFCFVVLIAAGVWWTNTRGPNGPVELTSVAAIAPSIASTPLLSAAQVEQLANYAPTAGGTIQWIASADDAYAIAGAVGRPVFLFGILEHCPLCKQLQERDFRDSSVLERAERCVPLIENLIELSPEALHARMQTSYPVLELHGPGRDVLSILRSHDFQIDVRAELERALGLHRSSAPTLPWERVRELCRALVRARQALAERRFSAAQQAFEEVSGAHEAPAFATLGYRGIVTLETTARTAIETARDASRNDDALARRSLENDAAAFADTRHAADLARVLDAWNASGRFPELRYAH